jgi:hypothetical protein
VTRGFEGVTYALLTAGRGFADRRESGGRDQALIASMSGATPKIWIIRLML